MTLKTLNVIRQVLAQEVETRSIAYRQARQAYANTDYDEDLREPMDQAWKAMDEVRMALHDFEDKEW